MKTTKIIIVVGTLLVIGIIINPIANIDGPDVTDLDAFGRWVLAIIVAVIGIALYRAADKEQHN